MLDVPTRRFFFLFAILTLALSSCGDPIEEPPVSGRGLGEPSGTSSDHTAPEALVGAPQAVAELGVEVPVVARTISGRDLLAGVQAMDYGVIPRPDPVIENPELPEETLEDLEEIMEELESTAEMTAGEFAELYDVPLADAITYNPLSASGLDLIQESSLALNEDELAILADNGFAITERHRYPGFVYGYEIIYSQDLPLYVTADSIIHAVHRSYDAILKAIELGLLIAELDAMLVEARENLAAGAIDVLDVEARNDADVYLAVALGLLRGEAVGPVANGDRDQVEELTAGALAADGMAGVTLFGSDRLMDFSQFKPRGHYTDSIALEQYFRSMMWLGRIDFRLVETQSDGARVFHRRQFEGAVAMSELITGSTRARWSRIDDVIEAFVGVSDNMTMADMEQLFVDLGVDELTDLASIDDEIITGEILGGGYGTQQISSHIMINGVQGATLPLSSTFLVLGQRYVVDSHVFSNVVYDRAGGGTILRMMPDPLDAAFAALANDQAGLLLEDQLETYEYAPDLHAMRVLVDAHGESFWTANLYNRWLDSLRALSPRSGSTGTLPEVATTEAWGRRILNAQLASWAELRHDTLLYAKQSYTGGTTCDFPDAYVDPYPEFFGALGEFATHGHSIILDVGAEMDAGLRQSVADYFIHLASVMDILEEMAEYQRDGLPFNDTHLAFINETVQIYWGCGSADGAEGWYPELFFNPFESVDFDPTIADVHTQPTDELGSFVGRILHVCTGMPRLMVTTVDTCGEQKAFVGLVSSYFERTTQNFERLDDETWASELYSGNPDDVAWMTDLVAR